MNYRNYNQLEAGFRFGSDRHISVGSSDCDVGKTVNNFDYIVVNTDMGPG
jgi:hypothetical protein